MAATPASSDAQSWLDRTFPEGGYTPQPDVSRAQSVVDIAPSGQVPMPSIEPPTPPSSMTYEQYAALPEKAQHKVWQQLKPWEKARFLREEAASRPA